MKRLSSLRHEDRGGAAIEMALALPIIIALIFGIFEAGMVLRSSAGMQHGVGEGARIATIFPTPAVATVSARVTSAMFGMEDAVSGYPIVSVVRGNNTDKIWYTIAVTYRRNVEFIFIPVRDVTMTHTKRVYVAQ